MISVLLPTRMRVPALRESVDSLIRLADTYNQVEILCAVDPDDHESAAACQQMKIRGVTAWTAPRRFGYSRLHEYLNFLASEATGDWLMLWNDDARMVTAAWDRIIMEQKQDRVLFPDVMYPCMGTRGNIFPVWPQWWYHNLGYVSQSPNADVWISELGQRLGREVRIPVQAVHDRQIGTGDGTHTEGRGSMGEGNDADYDSAANRVERARAVKILRGVAAAREKV